MKATNLYQQLEKDFINSKLNDEWVDYLDSVFDFLSNNFKKRSMGLVCDFTDEINKVYTAVFPSEKVLQKIIDDNVKDSMLFVHHPAIWDIKKAPEIFQQMNVEMLKKLKERHISIYNLHVPLDNFGKYSTSVSLAKALKIIVEKPFAEYFGSLCGIFGQTSFQTVDGLKINFEKIIGHKSKLYNYGENEIANGVVAIVAGGGNDIDILKEITKENVNTFITGVTIKNDFSKDSHEYARKNKINILGGTHYSTEKFACIAMTKYFEKAGLSSEFIPEESMIEDL